MDALCHEYGWGLNTVLHRTPLAVAFALYAAIAARYEQTPTGPTYAEQDLLAALRAAQGARSTEHGA
jgi:hypothetical protein